MRVLWVAMNASLYDASKSDGYGGIGWIGALFRQLIKNKTYNLELGVASIYNSDVKDVVNGVTFYGINSNKPTGLKKWLYYVKDYKKLNHLDYFKEISSVISDFKPDVIHLWGVENQLASVSHYKDIPVVAHLQGLLSLCLYTYYPYGINAHSLYLDRFSRREWVFHNGFVFGEHEMKVRAEIEKKHLKDVTAVMGRTHWDRSVALFNNPKVRYYHVDEAMREEFYSAPSWQKQRKERFVIYTTISDTIYKGLDVVIRAASILKEYNYFDFEWQIAGIKKETEFVTWFEKFVGLKCDEVNIRFLGRQSPEQLVSGLLGADLYVHPSYIDNSPNSLCEAQYLGVPCCATNVGGVASLIKDKETGVLIPANAPFDMAMAIKDCYENEPIWCYYADSGRKVAQERHDPERILDQLLTVYNDLTK